MCLGACLLGSFLLTKRAAAGVPRPLRKAVLLLVVEVVVVVVGKTWADKQARAPESFSSQAVSACALKGRFSSLVSCSLCVVSHTDIFTKRNRSVS